MVSVMESNRFLLASQNAFRRRYLAENGLDEVEWRIDLFSIEMSRSDRVGNIEHIPSAIEEQG